MFKNFFSFGGGGWQGFRWVQTSWSDHVFDVFFFPSAYHSKKNALLLLFGESKDNSTAFMSFSTMQSFSWRESQYLCIMFIEGNEIQTKLLHVIESCQNAQNNLMSSFISCSWCLNSVFIFYFRIVTGAWIGSVTRLTISQSVYVVVKEKY